ncbi:GlxA family transcriptional regulator [Pyxidicoccus sp. 3LG]
MPTVAIVALPQVMDTALALILEILTTANRVRAAGGEGSVFDTRVYGVQGKTVTTGLGFPFRAHARLEELEEHPASILVLPGQNETDPATLMGRVRSAGSRRLLRLLEGESRGGTLLAACCSATFYFAEAGLLDRRTATTTWFLASTFREHYPEVELQPEATLVRDGRTWTAGAAFSAVDMALALVRRFAGARVERRVMRYLVLEKHPTQARYMASAHLSSGVPEVAQAEAWVRAHLSTPFSVEDLARATRTSTRTLARRITRATGGSTVRFVQRIRAESAVHLLETTELSLDEVALRVGYQDASTLRRVLTREMQLGAREIRARRRAALVTRP